MNEPGLYVIADQVLKNSLRTILEGFIQLDIHFNRILFTNSMTLRPLSTSTYLRTDSKSENSLNDSTLNENFKSLELSPNITNLNIGNLIPLSCGHNGLYTFEETENFSLYLFSSQLFS